MGRVLKDPDQGRVGIVLNFIGNILTEEEGK